MAFKLTAGVWAFDPTHSYTAKHLALSNGGAFASVFPTAVNTPYAETYYISPGPGSMVLAPNSGHLIVGNYFHINPTVNHSGSLMSIDPATGTVIGFHQLPDITDVNAVPLSYSVRDLTINPTSGAGDERFIVTPDVFVRSSSAIYPVHPLTEMSYDGDGDFTVVSPPVTPFTVPNIGYTLSYNLASYDGAGNLLCPTHGGAGLHVFDSHEAHRFMASGANLPTMEAGLSGDGFNGLFPTVTKADFRDGSFAQVGGEDCSVNYDAAHGNMVVLGLGGIVLGSKLDGGTPALGPELIVNGGMAGTTGWNGFFNSTLTTVADSDFTSGEALVLTSTTGTANAAGQSARVAVTGGRNHVLSGHAKGITAVQTVTAQVYWYDVSGAQISVTSLPVVTEPSTGTLVYFEGFPLAPKKAVSAAFVVIFSATAIGEVQRLGDVSWKTVPSVATAPVDTNKARLVAGAPGGVFPNKGEIVGGRLLSATLGLLGGFPADIGASTPQSLISVDLAAVT
jgi:hypothetical protein